MISKPSAYRPPKTYTPKTQSGIGLLEVLVALIILALAILGYAAMQLRAVQTTGESIDRTQALSIMQAVGEKLRVNESMVDEYKKQFNAINQDTPPSKPTKMCGLDGKQVNSLCTSQELVTAESYLLAQQLSSLGFVMRIVDCPGNRSSNSIMNSQCIIASWADTKATIGTDDNNACLNTNGAYNKHASCMFMEIN